MLNQLNFNLQPLVSELSKISKSLNSFKLPKSQVFIIFLVGILLLLLLSFNKAQAQSFYGFPSYENNGQSFQPFAYFGAEPLWEDFQNFESHQVYGEIGSAIGQLETILEVDGRRLSGAYGCTATLIAEDIIITNYHCVPNQESRIELVNAFLRMDFVTAGESGDIYPVDIRVLESSERLDYAILRVENSPGRIYGFVPLRYRSAVENEELFMIHHTRAKPKQITRRNCTLLKRSQLEQLPIEMVGEFRQFNTETDKAHRCDSEEGSSGALVYAYSDGAVVGLHFAGTSSQLPIQQRANIFVDIAALVEQSPQLRSLAQPMNAGSQNSNQDLSNQELSNQGLSNQISLVSDSSSANEVPKPTVTADSGFLTLMSTPQGAEVYVNQEFLGLTPLQQYPLPKGRYDFRVFRDGYDVIDGYFQITAGHSTDGELTLVAQKGTGTETSTESNTESKNPFPTTAPVTASNTEGVKASQSSIGRENFGSISIYSEPIGADVLVNEKLIGQTPLIAYALDLGIYDITLRKDGYELYTDRASIARSRNTDVIVRLTEGTAEIINSFENTDVEPINLGTTQVSEETISNSLANGSNSEENAQSQVSPESLAATPVAFATPTQDSQNASQTDSQVVVSSAEDFIRLTRTGGVLRLGEGRFDLNGALSLNRDLEIIGAGADKTIIVSSAESHVLKLNNMRFQASGIAFEHTSGRWGNVVMAYNSQLDIQDASFSGAIWDSAGNQGGMGLWLSGSSTAEIRHSTFENNQLHGVYVSDNAEVVLDRNLIQNNGQNGVLFLGTSSGVTIGNVIESNGLHGISVGGQAKPSLENNTLQSNSKTGLFYGGNSSGVVKGNLISANSINGITIKDDAQLLLTDNRIDGNFWYGVYFDSASTSNLENNIIENNRAGRTNR